MPDEYISESAALQEMKNEPEKLAQGIWTKMQEEKCSHSSGQPSNLAADFYFNGLNVRALGLKGLSNSDFIIYSGPAQVRLNQSELSRQDLDGSHFARIGDASGKSIEVHWGEMPDQRYTLAERADKNWTGNYIDRDADGKEYTDYHYRHSDGSLETVYHTSENTRDSDHPRKLLITNEPDGTTIKSSAGTRPSDKFSLFSNEKQEFAIALDGSGERSINLKFSQSPQISSARNALIQALHGRHTDRWTETKLKVDMMRIESVNLPAMQKIFIRAGEKQAQARESAENEVIGLYVETTKLATNTDQDKNTTAKLGIRDERLKIACAEQIIEHAANPTEISQGSHPTCAMASLETRIYSRNPSEAARMVADLASKNEYESTFSSIKTNIDSDSLAAHSDSKSYVPLDGDRGIASQIFEVGAANLMYKKEKQSMRFSQTEPKDEKDSGDVLYDLKGSKIDDYPRNRQNWILDTSQEISGRHEYPWIIRAEDGIADSDRSIKVNSSKELSRQLEQASILGNFPLSAHVYTDHEPLYTESGDKKTHSQGGAHLLSISGYYPTRGAVEIDNQWSSKHDHLGKSALSLENTVQLLKYPYWQRFFRSFAK